MISIGYLIRTDLKKQLGAPTEESVTCLVLPPPDSTLNYSDAAEKAFEVAVEAIRQASRYPVIEENSRRRVYVEDLRPLRNSLLIEKEGWKSFSVRT